MSCKAGLAGILRSGSPGLCRGLVGTLQIGTGAQLLIYGLAGSPVSAYISLRKRSS